MKKYIKKYISAILLALVLCNSLMVTAFAVDSSATLELDSEGKVFTVNAEGLDPDMSTARATLVRCTYDKKTGRIGNVVAIGEEQFDVTDGKVINGKFVLNAQFSETDRNPNTTSLLIRVTVLGTRTGNTNYHNAVAFWPHDPTAKATYTVAFNLNGAPGNAPEAKTVTEGDNVTKPADPSWAGHNFDGWFTQASGGSQVTFPVSATANVTYYAHWSVSTVPVTGVRLDKNTLNATVGNAPVRLTATVTPDNATDKSVTWASSNTGVARVDQSGAVTFVSSGTATITATAGDKSATCQITVAAAAPSDDTPDTPDNPDNSDAPSGGSTGGNAGTTPGNGTEASDPNRVIIKTGANGRVTVSPRQAKVDETVTVTITPNTGYKLNRISAVDKNGKTVTLSGSDNTRTFKLPADYPVTISTSFVKGTTTTTTTTTDKVSFTDVKSSDYFYDAVAWAVGKNITQGKTETSFDPSGSCTRAQMVTFLWRYAGSPDPKSMSNPFTDLVGLENAYFYKAILWAVENGITNGTTDKTFSPNATVTRAQGVTFLYRCAKGSTNVTRAPFDDVPTTAYFAAAVQWAVSKEITGGYGNGLFGSGDPCTRAQIVTFLYRYNNSI